MSDRRSISYIKQTRAKIDRCNICGRIRPLTFDHVPPKATLLKPNVYASTALGEFPTPTRHMIRYQSGIQYRSIRQECNNKVLGVNDKELAKITDSVAKELLIPGISDTIVVTTKLNRVVRAICGHFVAMKMDFERKNHLDKQIREILFRSDKKLERLKLYCWFYPYTTVSNARDIVVVGKYHPQGMIGVMASFPLAYMISVKKQDVCGLDDLSAYMTKNIEDDVQVTLHLSTSVYSGTRIYRHFYWPMNIDCRSFSATGVFSGKTFEEASRFGVRE